MRQQIRVVVLVLMIVILYPIWKPRSANAEAPSAEAAAAFDRYAAKVEARLAQQHAKSKGFVAGAEDSSKSIVLQQGQLALENLMPTGEAEADGAMLHHWRGTAFVPGATGAKFEQVLRDYGDYPSRFAPEVVRATVLSMSAAEARAKLRFRQKHVLTVVLDATYDVRFEQLDAEHRYSMSRSSSIKEIWREGSPEERALSVQEEHGFLWRQNTYWSCEERDGGLLIQIETISLTRDIPRGLGWALRGYVESIPRETLAFTLTRMREALRR
ncbi:MAG: hypothetical protein KGN79_06460 [Acidobacteriota bacterium]|nr:hypothetical protein [Acidobacteriota bacterium]